ncbi:MAG: hypothetical protein QF752_08595 [Planctomycetota bacterium]|jgi:hypothetical protein|nr:hypothetical protein [Planctomycetota bacterium]
MTGEETKNRDQMNSGDLAWPVVGVLLSVIAILSLMVSLTGSSDASVDASSKVSTQDGSSGVDSSVWIKLVQKLESLESQVDSAKDHREVDSKQMVRIEQTLTSLMESLGSKSTDGEPKNSGKLLVSLAQRIGHEGPNDSEAIFLTLSRRLKETARLKAELAKKSRSGESKESSSPRVRPASVEALRQILLPLAKSVGVLEKVPRDGILVERPMDEILAEVVKKLQEPVADLQAQQKRQREEIERLALASGMSKRDARGERLHKRLVQRLKKLVDIEYRRSLDLNRIEDQKKELAEKDEASMFLEKQIEFLNKQIRELKGDSSGQPSQPDSD